MNFSRSLTYAVALMALGSAQAGWNRSPYAEARPVDLAATAIPGTSLVSSDGIGNPQSFIGGGLDEGVTLASGRSSAIIQLSSQQNVHTVAFINDGAEGKITIAGSADRKDWSVLGSSVFSASDRVAQIYFATATAKYLQVCFDSAKGGVIRSFEVFGESTDKDYSLVPKDLASGGSTVNLASAMGGARAIYAFPTPAHVGELNYLHGVFKFPMSREKFRTVIYDLGSVRSVSHFATSYSQRPMRVEVIAFQSLPEKKDWRGKPTLDPAIFDAVKPVAVAEDAKGVGHLKITPDQPVSARYIALRFEPNYEQDTAAVSLPDGESQDSIAEAGSQPEFRFAKNNAAGDITVGGVEFSSKDGYAITAQVGAGHMADNTPMKADTLVIGSGSSPSVATSYYFPASTAAPDHGAMTQSQIASPGKASAAAAKSSLPVAAGAFSALNAPVAIPKLADKSTAPSTGTTAPYVSTSKEKSSADSILVKSFTSQFDAASSKKNNHGRNCDHCYHCNRGGRCNHCGGHDDDHDDHGGNDHNDHSDHGGPITP